MVLFMKVNLVKENFLEKENSNQKMVINMMVNGKKINVMDMEYIYVKMVQNMKGMYIYFFYSVEK